MPKECLFHGRAIYATHSIDVVQVGFGHVDFSQHEDRSFTVWIHFRDEFSDIAALGIDTAI